MIEPENERANERGEPQRRVSLYGCCFPCVLNERIWRRETGEKIHAEGRSTDWEPAPFF